MIYLSDGPAPASDIDMLTTLKGKFTSQLDGRAGFTKSMVKFDSNALIYIITPKY